MKEHTFDAQIIAATPHSNKTNSFVKEVMRKINQSSGPALPRGRRGFIGWLTHLHKPAIALAAFVMVVLLGSAVYAAVHFAPALIQLLGKETNPRGATEYSVAGFAACSNMHNPVDRFEIASGAPALNDEEVRKILQARCETQWLQAFPGKQWPTYGTNSEWKDGDTIYYTRLDMMGTVATISETNAGIILGGRTVDYTPPQGEKIRAFTAGKEVSLDSIAPGDSVFTISRVSETYRKPDVFAHNKAESAINDRPNEQPKTLGLVAVFKLSLPIEYYLQKQGYLTEIPECFGNKGELCPNTPSVDVYPRTGGEGATNPYLQNVADGVSREISGSITELNDDTLTLKSRSGKLYTVSVGDSGFKVYNRDYTAPYAASHIDATLKVGSHVSVHYHQPKDADAQTIAKEHVWRVVLQLEGTDPKKNVKPY